MGMLSYIMIDGSCTNCALLGQLVRLLDCQSTSGIRNLTEQQNELENTIKALTQTSMELASFHFGKCKRWFNLKSIICNRQWEPDKLEDPMLISKWVQRAAGPCRGLLQTQGQLCAQRIRTMLLQIIAPSPCFLIKRVGFRFFPCQSRWHYQAIEQADPEGHSWCRSHLSLCMTAFPF